MNPAELQTQLIHAFARWMSSAHPRSSLFEAPGVTAAVVPASPSHSIPNSVGYDSHSELEAAYPELEERFDDSGIRAWTVWVPEADTAAESFLSERGHAFDGDPAAMVLHLDSWEPPVQGDLDWDSEATPQELAELNDLAYGHQPGDGMGAAMRDAPQDDSVRIYRARVNDETASVLGTIDVGTDAGVLFVATPPAMRGRGLSGRLLSQALLAARERGMKTSSLQASAMGFPVYERLGYEVQYRFRLLERRTPSAE